MDLVILDRDGVINEDSPRHIRGPDEWKPIPGSLEAIARLGRAGFRVVVATNQSGIRRRLFTIEDLNRIHAKMHRALAEVGGRIEAVFYCPCLPRDGCACFKPQPGMLLEIGTRLRVALDTVPFVGDKATDIEAARAAGARPILVRTGNGEATLEAAPDLAGVDVHDDLASFADTLIASRRSA